MNKTKRVLGLVLSVMMLLGMVSVYAVSFSYAAVDGAYTFTVSDGAATITAYNGTEANLSVPASVGGFSVSAIGSHAFEGNTAIKTVELPTSVVSIGAGAFLSCTNLAAVVLPDALQTIGDGAFMDSGLTTLYIPEKVTYIGIGALSGCDKLEELTVPYIGNKSGDDGFMGQLFDGVTPTGAAGFPKTLAKITVTADSTVDNYAFYGLTALQEIDWRVAPSFLGQYAFYNCGALHTIKNSNAFFGGISEIGAYAFAKCVSLEMINLPDNITTIGTGAFSGDTKLETIIATDALDFVGSGALTGTAWLAEQPSAVLLADVFITYKGAAPATYTLPEKAASLADGALANRKDIKTLVIPETVSYIGTGVLSGNTGVSTVTIPYIGASASDVSTPYISYLYGGTAAAANATALPSVLKTVHLSEGLTAIPASAFEGSRYITSVTVPASVSDIGTKAFANSALKTLAYNAADAAVANDSFADSAISKITFGNTVEVIPSYLCTNNASLTEITIPESTQTIGSRAFAGCYNIGTLNVNARNLTLVASDAFTYCHKLSKITLGSAVEHIPVNLFSLYGGSNLTELTIPENITSIDARAFSECVNLETVYYNAKDCKIGKEAFSGCTKLKNVVFGDRVEVLPANLLTDNKAIAKLKIPANITEIESEALAGTTSLTNIAIPRNLRLVGENALNHSAWKDMQSDLDAIYLGKAYYAYQGEAGAKDVKIATGTYSITGGAFVNGAAETVLIPSSVVEIADNAFDADDIIACYDTNEVAREYAKKNNIVMDLRSCSHGSENYYYEVVSRTESGSNTVNVFCRECNEIVKTETRADAALTSQWVLQSAPTCSEDGVITKQSTGETAALPATGDHMAVWQVTKNATCVQTGLKELICCQCGKTLDTDVVATVAHTSGAWQVVKQPTTLASGLRAKFCTVCGAQLETQPIDKLAVTEVDRFRFQDVNSGDWFYDTVYFAADHGLFEGVDETHFDPNSNMTRAMFVTVLGRLAGANVNHSAKVTFTDVKRNTWYTGYVKWAADNKIVEGYSKQVFAPNTSITRQDMCTILVRYCDYAGIELTDKVKEVFFKDSDEISSYALNTVLRCQRAGIVEGRGKGYFEPKGNATRAEVAQLLRNFAENFLMD